MNKFVIVLLCLCNAIAFSQNIQFPESFKYDPKIIPEMRIAVITDEAREHGIFKNPAVLTTEAEMSAVVNDFELINVKRVYIEFYEEIKKEERNDAGIVVTEFNSKENLEDVLPLLTSQSNYVWLYVDKYLILVWNDGQKSDERLRKSVDYYKKKLGAEEFVATNESSYADKTSTEVDYTTEATMEEPVAMVAPEGMLTELGFGTVRTELFSQDELINLQNYIRKFEDKYNIEVGMNNVYDLTDEMTEGYASHLVWTFEERIKK